MQAAPPSALRAAGSSGLKRKHSGDTGGDNRRRRCGNGEGSADRGDSLALLSQYVS